MKQCFSRLWEDIEVGKILWMLMEEGVTCWNHPAKPSSDEWIQRFKQYREFDGEIQPEREIQLDGNL